MVGNVWMGIVDLRGVESLDYYVDRQLDTRRTHCSNFSVYICHDGGDYDIPHSIEKS